MRSFRKLLLFAAVVTGGVFALRAELPSLDTSIARNTVGGSAIEAALYRVMNVPGGPVLHSRPPSESRMHLAKLISQSPHEGELYSLRAREDERALEITAAEDDWKRAAEASANKVAAIQELADFYHRRVEPDKEVGVLLQLGAVPQQTGEQFQPDPQQAQWSAFRRCIDVANESLLPSAEREQIYEAWIRRYPKSVEPYQSFLDWLIQQKNAQEAAAVALRIKAAFPADVQLAVSTDANLARVESGPSAALEVYAKSFSPFWPDALKTEYFQGLANGHQLRAFLANAQSAAVQNPTALDPALRIYFYYDQQNRKDAADQELLSFLTRRAASRAAWRADELKTVGTLFQRVQDYDESARAFYLLYELPAAAGGR